MLQKINQVHRLSSGAFLLSLIWIFLGAFSRLIPHPPNFTAIGAVAVMGGLAYTMKKWSLIVPVTALFLSDLILGFHDTMIWVYAAVLIVAVVTSIRARNLSKKSGPVQLIGVSFASTLVFFLVTNFGVWMTGSLYPMTAGGLLHSYVAALPFALNQLLADLFFIPLAVFSYQWALGTEKQEDKTAIIPEI